MAHFSYEVTPIYPNFDGLSGKLGQMRTVAKVGLATWGLLFASSPSWVHADDPPSRLTAKTTTPAKSPKRRAVLVLATAQSPSAKTRETRFVAELRLALDGVRVLRVQPSADNFVAKPLGEQVDLVREELQRTGGLAATWLHSVSADLVLVHMVVLSSGRVLVRLIEGNPQRQGFAVDLAMASRELLGAAFLFDPKPPVERPVARVVESVRERAARGERAQPAWALMTLVRAGGGLAGYTGPSLLLGGKVVAERTLGDALKARALLELRGGPLQSTGSSHDVRTTAAALGLGLAYFWGGGSAGSRGSGSAGLVRWGPVLELTPTWTSQRVQATASRTQTFALWSVRAELGPEARVALGDLAELVAAGSVGIAPQRKVLVLASDGTTLTATPTLAWGGSLGLAVHFR